MRRRDERDAPGRSREGAIDGEPGPVDRFSNRRPPGLAVAGSLMLAVAPLIEHIPARQVAMNSFPTLLTITSSLTAGDQDRSNKVNSMWLALKLKHIGLQDRGVPVLILYSGNIISSESKLLSECGRSAECHPLNAGKLNRIADALVTEFPHSTFTASGQAPPCTYQIIFENADGLKTREFDPISASRLLARLLVLLENDPVRPRVARLRDICPD